MASSSKIRLALTDAELSAGCDPASGYDGMHSLSMEGAKTVPMATEDGHDRVLNFETMICGAAWA